MLVAGAFAVGLIIGAIVAILLARTRSIGALRVDCSDPDDGPYLFLELHTDPEVIKRKKFVTLKVNVKNFISHK